jgi:predicted DNA-binding transcriptional regulator AlpA
VHQDWTDRTVRGPAADLLTQEELCTFLGGISSKTLKRMVDAGDLPEPLQLTPGIDVWAWEDVVYYRLRMALKARFKPAPAAPEADKRGHQPDK